MDVQQLLLDTLDDLRNEELKRFTWYLNNLKLGGYQAIPASHTENVPRQDIVEKMVKRYHEDGAVTVTIDVLKKMGNNNTAEKLRTAYTEGKAAEQNLPPPPSTSSPALPPASVTITAQSGSVVFAPTISRGSIGGPLNMKVTK